MVYNIYTVFDIGANEAGPLFQAKNHHVALRHFDQINETVHRNSKGDYVLKHLGTYDTESMELKIIPPANVEINIDSEGV